MLVENKATRKKAKVTIIDRGPFCKGKGIDLSKCAAKKIGLRGVATVKIEPLTSGDFR